MDSSRCSSCAAAIPTPRPDACPYCGTLLPALATAAPRGGPGRSDDVFRLPLELAHRLEWRRGVAAGLFAALFLVALLVTFFMLFMGVRVEQAPPPNPSATQERGR